MDMNTIREWLNYYQVPGREYIKSRKDLCYLAELYYTPSRKPRGSPRRGDIKLKREKNVKVTSSVDITREMNRFFKGKSCTNSRIKMGDIRNLLDRLNVPGRENAITREEICNVVSLYYRPKRRSRSPRRR
jgi:hypothetical protein